jgi:hypothetical protein
MARVVLGGGLGASELLGGGSLSSGVEVLNLGFAKDAVRMSEYVSESERAVVHPCVARGRLVDVGLVNDEEDLKKTSASAHTQIAIVSARAVVWCLLAAPQLPSYYSRSWVGGESRV